MFYGWGRVDFASAAAAASASVPSILRLQSTAEGVLVFVPCRAGWNCSLWRSDLPATNGWQLVPGVTASTNGGELILRDPLPPAAGALYRVGFGSW